MHERHSFLTRLLGVTKPEEDESYSTIVKLLIWSNTCTLLFGAAEVGMYFAYAFKVNSCYKKFLKDDFLVYFQFHPWRFIIHPPETEEEEENKDVRQGDRTGNFRNYSFTL